MTQQGKEKFVNFGSVVAVAIFIITTIFWTAYSYYALTGLIEWKINADFKIQKMVVIETEVGHLIEEITRLRNQFEIFNNNYKIRSK